MMMPPRLWRTDVARGAYYNENDPAAAAWLRELIARGLIAPGLVDDRSIVDVRPEDLDGFVQHHFFAGIGGWSFALRLAGWPDAAPVWTASCPCQPLSSAGQRQEHVDERHLWPAVYRLIAERQPPVLFGEQVANTAGREWFAAVRHDLEAAGYACGCADLPAACVGAPHIRQRLFFTAARVDYAARHGRLQWWAEPSKWSAGARRGAYVVGDAIGPRLEGFAGHGGGGGGWPQPARPASPAGASDRLAGWQRVVFSADCDEEGNCPICGIDYAECGCPGPTQDDEFEYEERADGLFARRLAGGVVADAQSGGSWPGLRDSRPGAERWPVLADRSPDDRVADAAGQGRSAGPGWLAEPNRRAAAEPGRLRHAGGLADIAVADADGGHAETEGLQRGGQHRLQPQDGRTGIVADAAGGFVPFKERRAQGGDGPRPDGADLAAGSRGTGEIDRFWADPDWLFCRDERWRPVEPGSFPLANGIPARVVRLRGYGNAIVPQAAAAFIDAFVEDSIERWRAAA